MTIMLKNNIYLIGVLFLLNSASCKEFENIDSCDQETIVNYNVLQEVEWIYNAVHPLEVNGHSFGVSSKDVFRDLKLYVEGSDLYYVMSRTKTSSRSSSTSYEHTNTIYDCIGNKIFTFNIRDRSLSSDWVEVKKWE